MKHADHTDYLRGIHGASGGKQLQDKDLPEDRRNDSHHPHGDSAHPIAVLVHIPYDSSRFVHHISYTSDPPMMSSYPCCELATTTLAHPESSRGSWRLALAGLVSMITVQQSAAYIEQVVTIERDVTCLEGDARILGWPQDVCDGTHTEALLNYSTKVADMVRVFPRY